MKNYIKLLFVFMFVPFALIAQEDDKKEEKVKEKLERSAFDSSTLIDTQTNTVLSKNSLEVYMAHRFGFIDGGRNDLAGFWAPSNIRIGLSFAPHERVTLGFATVKFDRLQDFNWKVAILRQTRSNKMPVSVSYYGNFVVDARNRENFKYTEDRFSFFNQLIIAKRFSPGFSMQIAPSVSHYNVVNNTMRNDMIAVSVGGRIKISSQTGLILDYTQPLTKFTKENPHPGISVGVEFSTSAHAFQIFATNYNGLVPQKNIMFNQNDYFKGDVLIGFNITRIYNF